ncbi:MAG TPA: hypothetical protein VHF27_02345, partial [Acidimicrobiales bacterium]|nr:hypothetical protein [Acidimicrobiales bacterium]
SMAAEEDLGRAVGGLAGGGADRATFARTVKLVGSSVRAAGAKPVASGRWLADALLDAAPHIPVRDVAALSAAHGGRTGRALAEELIRSASHRTAGFGAAAGALAGAHSVAPPTWVALPAELVAETLAVVAVELKLVAELHEAYGTQVTDSTAIVVAWAEGRGVGQVLSRAPRRELAKVLQRRLAARAVRNTASWIPLMAGAVAGAELNRRATRALGDKVLGDLASRA